jgi:hypothetical protein
MEPNGTRWHPLFWKGGVLEPLQSTPDQELNQHPSAPGSSTSTSQLFPPWLMQPPPSPHLVWPSAPHWVPSNSSTLHQAAAGFVKKERREMISRKVVKDGVVMFCDLNFRGKMPFATWLRKTVESQFRD